MIDSCGTVHFASINKQPENIVHAIKTIDLKKRLNKFALLSVYFLVERSVDGALTKFNAQICKVLAHLSSQ